MSASPGRSESGHSDVLATHADAKRQTILVKRLGKCDYLDTWEAMRAFTNSRLATSQDELWLLEHPPIFTLGQAGRREHILDAGDIPVVQVDRGGQVTYHGPGQLIAYLLLDLGRAHLGIKALVNILENAIKFSAEGSMVAVRARRAGEAVVLEFTDQGCGVAPGATERIFDRFFRGQSTPAPGLGLGLYITRSLIEILGGSVRAQNRTDGEGGLVISVSLPAAAGRE